MKVINPVGSYSLLVPSETIEEYDGRVTSLWQHGDEALLQLSSSRRVQGDQVSAIQRLEERLQRTHYTSLKILADVKINCPDVVAAECLDEEGFYWIYIYAVWEFLAIFVSISSRDPGILDGDNWLSNAAKSLALI